jgi:hypothetical protein
LAVAGRTLSLRWTNNHRVAVAEPAARAGRTDLTSYAYHKVLAESDICSTPRENPMATTMRVPGFPRWVGVRATIKPGVRRTGDAMELRCSVHVPRARGLLYGLWLHLTRR